MLESRFLPESKALTQAPPGKVKGSGMHLPGAIEREGGPGFEFHS